MKVLKISVVGGGIDGFSEWGGLDKLSYYGKRLEEINPDAYALATDKENPQVDLVPRSARLGMIARLAGETEKIVGLMKGPSFKEIEEAADGARLGLTKKPWLELFAGRKRTIMARGQNVAFPNLISECTGNNAVFADFITEVFGTNKASEIYRRIHELNGEALNEKHPKLMKERVDSVIENLDKVKGDFLVPSKKGYKPSSFITSLIEKLSTLKESQKLCPTFKDLRLTEEVLAVLEKITCDFACRKDHWVNSFKTSADSVPILQKTAKSWSTEKPDVVTRGVNYALKFDFNMYIEVSDGLYNRIKNGPQFATFGHGGGATVTEIDDNDIVEKVAKSLIYNCKMKSVNGFESVKYDVKENEVTYFEYEFSSSNSKVGAYDCHALFTRIVSKGKADQGSSLVTNKGTILVRTMMNLDLQEGSVVEIKDKMTVNKFKLISRTKNVKKFKISDDENKGLLEISLKSLVVQKNNGRDLYAVNCGGGIREDVVKRFLSNCGLEVKEMKSDRFSPQSNGKVSLERSIDIKATVKVKEFGRFAHALVEGVGRKRSYGLGLIQVAE